MRLRTILAPLSIAALAVLASAPAFADAGGSPNAGKSSHASSTASQSINGAAVSSLPEDRRRLSVEGKLGSDGVASGRLSFTHHSPSGLSHFTARVTCLEFTDGRTEVSGIISKGETAAGIVLDGKPVAFTIDTDGAQKFSLPQIGPGAADCGGGREETVPVTQAGFHVR